MFFAARNTSITPAPHMVVDAKPIDLWDAWQFAANEATLKLRIWSTAPNADKASIANRRSEALRAMRSPIVLYWAGELGRMRRRRSRTLGISAGTVKNHISEIFKVLNATNRTQVAQLNADAE